MLFTLVLRNTSKEKGSEGKRVEGIYENHIKEWANPVWAQKLVEILNFK